jgi:hypothetical protein
LSKFYYKPILEKVKESFLENANREYDPGFDIESNVRLVIEAEDAAAAERARIGFIDNRMWELEKSED